jgi:murein DD-endopeptidase MepM/ murein hydrolase activator NlpD
MKRAVKICGGFALCAAFLGFVHVASAEESCSRDVMCVSAVPNGDGVDIYVQNRQTAEITVTLDAKLTNMSTNRSLPYTATYPGLKTVKAFTLQAADAKQLWDYRWSYKWDWGPMQAKHDDSYLYSLPYESGKAYRIDQGYNGHFSHFGDFQYSIDWNMPVGTPILAAREGVVVGVRDEYQIGAPDRAYENKANYIMIKHPDGTIGEYAHLMYKGVKVKVGDRVQAGELIGYSGNTGFTTGPHLHFFVYKAVDGAHRQSFPVRFRLRNDQPTMLVEGEAYQAYGH